VNSIHEYAAYCYYTDWVVWRSVYLSTVYTVSLPWSCALQNTWIEMSFGLQCRGLLTQLSLLNSAHGAKAAYVDMACWPLLPWHFVNSSSRLWITQSLWLWRMTSGRRHVRVPRPTVTFPAIDLLPVGQATTQLMKCLYRNCHIFNFKNYNRDQNSVATVHAVSAGSLRSADHLPNVIF